MKTPFNLLILAALLLAGCGQSDNKSAAGNNPAPASASADYAGALGRSESRALKVVDTAALNQAVQLFNAQEGRNPKDLNELLQSKFIHEIPQTPPGMKLSYDPDSGVVRVVPQ